MFKHLIGMAACAMTANAVVENTAEMACQSIATSDGAFFSITKLETTEFYESLVTGSTDKLQFNYCTYGIIEDDAFGLVVTAADDDDDIVVASKNVSWTSADTLEDENKKNIGVTFSQKSNTECDVDADKKFSMRTNLYCDKKITAKGEAKIVSVTKTDCEYVVEMKHAAGCPTVDLDIDTYLGWLSENEWAIGIIYLIIGPVVALRGLAWFPYVTAALMAIFVIGIVCSFSLAMSWMVTTTGTIVTLCVALVLGIIAGMVIRRNIWIMIGVLGLIAGFFSGSLVYALIFGLTGWKAVWGYWVISVAMAVILCAASCKFGSGLILISTSFTGSYLFMRSWTLFFPGNWPSEAEIMQEDFELETGAVFWVFVGVFVFGFVGSIFYQKKYSQKHEDLDEYDRQ